MAVVFDLHPLAQRHQYVVEQQADARALLAGLVEDRGAHVHHVGEGPALVDRAAQVQYVAGQLGAVAPGVLHPHQPQRVLGVGGIHVALVAGHHEQLPGVHAEGVPPGGHRALAVHHAVDHAVGVGVVPADQEIRGRFQHDAGPVHLDVQAVRVHRPGRQVVHVVGHAAHDVVLQVVRVIVAAHGFSPPYIKIIQHLRPFVHRTHPLLP